MNAASAAHPPVGAESKADPVRLGFPIDYPGGPPPPPPPTHTTTVSLCAMQTTSTPDCTQKQHEAAHIRRRKWRRENPGTAWTSR